MKLFLLLSSFFALVSTGSSYPQDTSKVNEYHRERNRVIAQDNAIRLGSEIELSQEEVKVDSLLASLRAEFIKNAGSKFPPAHYFYIYRNMIDSSKILGILRSMPKGGLLHCHAGAIGSPDWIINKASHMENLYMYTGETKGYEVVYGTLRFYNPGTQPEGYELVADLRKKDPNFDDHLRELLFLNESDFKNGDIWVRFEEIFTRQGGLLEYYPVFLEDNKVMIDSLIADNVQHIEIRTFLGGVYDLNGKKYTPEEVIEIYKSILDSVRKDHPEFTLKIIRSGYRGWDKPDVLNYMEETIKLRKKYSDLVIGFDLVGEEDAGNPTLYFIEEMLLKDSLEEVYDIDLPFYFHNGESTLPDNDNLYDAVLLGTKRIGHGINLFRFPILFDIIKQKGIALEISPLSNQILGYTDNLRMHPAGEYIKRGIPETISSDDPQIFDYTGLSYDFWSAYMAWNLDLAQMKKLAVNSITYSGMSDTEIQTALTYFNSAWDKWVEEVLETEM